MRLYAHKKNEHENINKLHSQLIQCGDELAKVKDKLAQEHIIKDKLSKEMELCLNDLSEKSHKKAQQLADINDDRHDPAERYLARMALSFDYDSEYSIQEKRYQNEISTQDKKIFNLERKVEFLSNEKHSIKQIIESQESHKKSTQSPKNMG